MYGFKGKLAELLFDYQPCEGTQLQHFLGNIFKEEFLHRIFEKYKLENLIRFRNNFDAQKHKHIFVYGLLGFVCKYQAPEKMNQFIVNNFLTGTEHLIPGFDRNKDFLAQCNYFASLVYKSTVTEQTIKTEDEKFKTVILVDKLQISDFTSTSYCYSRKKALKEALKTLAESVSKEYENNPIVQKIRDERQKAEEKEKQNLRTEREKIRLQKLRDKKAEKSEKQKRAATIAKMKDTARRQAKQAAKQHRERMEEIQFKKAAAEARMSGKKRRHLDDKKK